jgi:solute:Na+ symporter, SSS family
MAFLGSGVGYMVAAKTMMALTPKPVEKYTLEERASVDLFQEFQALRSRDAAELSDAERLRFDELAERRQARRAAVLRLLHQPPRASISSGRSSSGPTR